MPGPVFAHKLHLTAPGSAAPPDLSGYVQKAGDTMTGFLTLHDDPTDPLHAVTKRYVDGLIDDELFEFFLTREHLQHGLLQQRGMLTNIDAHALTTPTTTGTATAVQDTSGSYVNYATSSSLGNTAGWVSDNAVQLRQQPLSTFVIKTGTDITSVRYWLALSDLTVVTDDMESSGFTSADIMGFRFSTNVPDTNWECATREQGDTVLTKTNSGVPVVADTRYVLQMRVTSGLAVEFYINGSLVATHAKVPDASTTLGIRLGVQTQTNASRSLRIRRASIISL